MSEAQSKATLPLRPEAASGGWTLSVGIQCLFLGDAASSFNDDNHFKVIGTAGIPIEF